MRQGDIFILKMKSEIPETAVPVRPRDGRYILAEGEATGHCHAIASRHAQMFALGAAMYLRVLQESEVNHEEHGTLPLDPGDYEVRRQREYTPEFIRNVAD